MIVAVWYGLVPVAGAFYSRYKWKRFRKRFSDLGLVPLLDYRQYHQSGNEDAFFRFTGEIESITDGSTLWVKGADLTLPVSLDKTKCFLLPKHEGDGLPEPPEQIRWNRAATLTEGIKVFIGGQTKIQNNRLSFVSTRETPLIVIFYNCAEEELTSVIIHAARNRNDYWNSVTPISLFIGAVSLIYIATSLLGRPAFRPPVITALVAVFVPILPIIPPGLFFTFFYRRLAWTSQLFKSYRELAQVPLRYLKQGQENCVLGTGEKYGFVKLDSLKQIEGEIPFLIPGSFRDDKKQQWYFFGILDKENEKLPVKSRDPFVSFGILPAGILSRGYAIRAYILEALAGLAVVIGTALNVIFILLILVALGAF